MQNCPAVVKDTGEVATSWQPEAAQPMPGGVILAA